MTLMDPRANELATAKLYSATVIGHTSATTARIWARLYQPGKWTLVLSTSPFTGDLTRLNEQTIRGFLKASGIKPAFIGEHDFDYSSNLTHTFDVDGLEPFTRYYYALMCEDKSISRRTELGYSLDRYFRTQAENARELVFGFYSCHDPINADNSVGAWPHMLEQLCTHSADFVIGGGDQVYVDTNAKQDFPDVWVWLKDNKDELLQTYRKGRGYDEEGIYQYLLNLYRWFYRVYWQVAPLQAVYRQFPQYMIWDDHEIMDGWGSYTEKERLHRLSRLFKADDKKVDGMLIDLMWRAACRAYYEFEHSHNPHTPYDEQNPDNCQWDYSFSQGPAAFYVLDMRGQHDVEKDPKQDPFKILGRAQMDRFLQWLSGQAENPACKVLFVVSPVPMLHWVDALVNYADLGSIKDDLMDEWDHDSNWAERAVILNNVFAQLDKHGKLLVFLSGDVHCASVYQLTHNKYLKARVYQLTSSAISRKPAPAASLIGISSGGALKGCKGIVSERLFALTGHKNFSLLHVFEDASGTLQTEAQICWPGENAGETISKRIRFK